MSRALMGKSWILKSRLGQITKDFERHNWDLNSLHFIMICHGGFSNRRLAHSNFYFKFEVMVMGLDGGSRSLQAGWADEGLNSKDGGKEALCGGNQQDFFDRLGGKMGRVRDYARVSKLD